jgi:poly-gamma-glutamate capsule biosynthesis protein CapA/YwtB (metallophosphatase superfamily)
MSEAKVRPPSGARVALIWTLLLALAGCGGPPVLLVSVDPGVSAQWERLLQEHPLPPELRLEIVDEDASDPTDRSGEAAITFRSGVEGVPDGKLVYHAWRVPVVTIDDPRESIRSAELGTVDIADLSEVVPPLKGLSIDGLYPGDHLYPLQEGAVVRIHPDLIPSRLPEGTLRELTGWYEAIVEAPTPHIVWIGAVGDVMPGRGVTELLDQPDGLTTVFGGILAPMQQADFLVGNLEGSVTTRGAPLQKGYTFRFHPRVLSSLQRAGFDYFSVTNNHAFDYGQVGFTDTLTNLALAQIATSGAGENLEAASTPYTQAIGSTIVKVLSIGAYPREQSGFDGGLATAAGAERRGVLWAGEGVDTAGVPYRATALRALEQAFGHDSFDLVLVHGGEEWATAPSERQRELYRSFIDSGTDLVIGSHSHVLQGVEVYRGRLIAYSMGNFVFPGMYETRYGEESALLLFGVEGGRVRYLRFLPVRINHQTLSLDTSEQIRERFIASTRAMNDR